MLRVLLYFLIFTLVSCKSSIDKDRLFEIVNSNNIDILIKNGLVYDGLGNPPVKTDILVSGDEIVYIGDVDIDPNASRILEAQGYSVTPGFIDPHAHGNPVNGDFKNFIAQGVTSIALGQDGGSPFTDNFIDWKSRVDSSGLLVNIIPFIGHGTLRNFVGVPLDGRPDSTQLLEMNRILTKVLQEGVFGMTTGLEYVPGFYSKEEELLSLAKTVGSQNGLIMSHMRNEDNNAVDKSLRELIKQGQYSRVQASHLKVVYGKGEKRAAEILSLMDSARREGITIYADTYPYIASYTGIGIVFPEWALPPNDFGNIVKTRRKDLKEYLIKRIEYRNGPEATLFGTQPWKGKTLEFIADSLGKHYADILIDNIGPGGASAAYFVMNDALQKALFKGENVMACSDGSPTMHHPRGYGSYAKIIEEYVVKDSLISFAEAVFKMSGLPAESIAITDRGSIKVGNKADLLIFKPQNIKSTADFSDPHQYATGFDYVIVNGKMAYSQKDNKVNEAGKVLTKDQ